MILKRKREPAVSRVLSWAIIHLGQPLPAASSNLPGSPLRPRSGRNCPTAPLFGLAPSGVCLAAACCPPRGALLPHHFTLTSRRPAVYFLWHFPWARALQALPGALPDGARTFLQRRYSTSDCLADSHFPIPETGVANHTPKASEFLVFQYQHLAVDAISAVPGYPGDDVHGLLARSHGSELPQ